MPVALLVLGLLVPPVLLGVANYLCTVAIDRRYRGFESDEIPEVPASDPPWIARQTFEVLRIRSHDGLWLQGYYLAAPRPTNRVAIVAHGYRGNALRDMGEWAQLYHDRLGYNVLLPDARAHGASEGRYIGFGWLERKDMLRWIGLMVDRHGADAAIVLHGLSMGAATVMMTAGEELPSQVRCVIEDCGYTSVIDELSHQLRQMYHLPPFPLMPLASRICRLRAGYTFEEASALDQLRRASTPVLFIHGGADSFVPTGMVYRLHEACAAPKALLVVPDAGHAMAIFDAPERYARTVEAFVARWLDARTGTAPSHAIAAPADAG